MGVKLEPVVRTFYEELEKGENTGFACKRCGLRISTCVGL